MTPFNTDRKKSGKIPDKYSGPTLTETGKVPHIGTTYLWDFAVGGKRPVNSFSGYFGFIGRVGRGGEA